MAKTTAALLSLGASGTIGKTMTFASWKGVPYARQRVVPANPRTAEQQLTRTTFALLREMWKINPAIGQEPWTAFAQGRPFTNMNKYVGENLRVLRGEIDMANFIGSPGARGGPPPASVTVAAGGAAGEIDASATADAPPPGWTLVGMQAVCFMDQDPSVFFEGGILAAEDLVAPYEITFSGLTVAQEYVVSVWLKWQKPDGKFAYSVSVTNIALPHV